VVEQQTILPLSFLTGAQFARNGAIEIVIALSDYQGATCVQNGLDATGAPTVLLPSGPCGLGVSVVATSSDTTFTQASTMCSIANGGCTMTWTWPISEAVIDDSASIAFRFESTNTYATSFNYSISTPSGYPNQANVISAVHSAPAGFVFRGDPPTTFPYALIQVLYDNQVKSVKSAGYLVSEAPIVDGQLLSVQEFHDANGVGVTFVLTTSTDFFVQVVLQAKLQLSVLVTVLFGLIGNAKGIVEQVLQYLEKFGPFALRFLCCKVHMAEIKAMISGAEKAIEGEDDAKKEVKEVKDGKEGKDGKDGKEEGERESKG